MTLDPWYSGLHGIRFPGEGSHIHRDGDACPDSGVHRWRLGDHDCLLNVDQFHCGCLDDTGTDDEQRWLNDDNHHDPAIAHRAGGHRGLGVAPL